MKIDIGTFQLKNGREVFLRSPEEKDANAMLQYLKMVAEETDFLVRYPEEITKTVEEEAVFLQGQLAAERSFMLSAFDEEQIIGNVSINAVGGQQKLRHRASVGIAVIKEYWGLGLGRQLMVLAEEQAYRCGYEQIELGVYENNEAARSLYTQLGYEKTGRAPHAFRLKDGTYADEIMMVKVL